MMTSEYYSSSYISGQSGRVNTQGRDLIDQASLTDSQWNTSNLQAYRENKNSNRIWFEFIGQSHREYQYVAKDIRNYLENKIKVCNLKMVQATIPERKKSSLPNDGNTVQIRCHKSIPRIELYINSREYIDYLLRYFPKDVIYKSWENQAVVDPIQVYIYPSVPIVSPATDMEIERASIMNPSGSGISDSIVQQLFDSATNFFRLPKQIPAHINQVERIPVNNIYNY